MATYLPCFLGLCQSYLAYVVTYSQEKLCDLDIPYKISDRKRRLLIQAGFVSWNVETAALKITCNNHSFWFVFFRCVQSVPPCRGGIHSRKVGILFNTLICGTNLNMTHMWWVNSYETLGSLLSNDDDDTKKHA